jgi:small subunit ribosomal protein S8
MSSNDPLANVLSKINNAEKIARNEISFDVSSKLIKSVLDVMKDNGYLGEVETVKNLRGESYKINLIGKINNCNAIKPNFAVKVEDFEKFEKRFLPAKNFGLLILTTPKGVMTQEEAKKNNLGGKLIAYCY